MPTLGLALLQLPPLQIGLLLLLLLLLPSDALQLRHSWKAAKGSVLAAAPVAVVPTGISSSASSASPQSNAVGPPSGERDCRGGRQLLATAGHDGGTVRFWSLAPFPEEDGGDDGDDDNNGSKTDTYAIRSTAEGAIDLHRGSIFALSSDGCGQLVSGSFDRTASLHRIVFDSSSREGLASDAGGGGGGEGGEGGEVAASVRSVHLGSLPEHTGWVRGVKIVTTEDDDGDDDGKGQGRYLLSIGCNLVNVWTAESAPPSDLTDDGVERRTERIARLDAGPSPGDPPDEPFRRHDILCLDVVRVNHDRRDGSRNSNESNEGPGWIVTGLVDGTVRAFDARWDYWSERAAAAAAAARRGGRDEPPPYDGTGSCARVVGADDADDDRPCAAESAHGGSRVTGVHAVPGCSREFVSVGHDGRWKRWRIHNDRGGTKLVEVASGEIPDKDGDDDDDDGRNDRRICSSILVPCATGAGSEGGRCGLFLGTIGGSLYRVALSNGSGPFRCDEIWTEDDGGECAITALSWIELPSHQNKQDGRGGAKLVVVAGTSSGILRVFR